MVNILIAEDDPTLLKVMRALLTKKGYNVFCAANGSAALALMEKEHIDLLITDIMMPGTDGYTLVRDIRAAGFSFPVMMITAKEKFEDKEEGFISGADDYMVKPIDINEMALRADALLRRAKINASRMLENGNVRLLADMLTVHKGDTAFELPQKEFQVLFKLLSYPGKIFTRQTLIEEIWGMDSDSEERTVDVHINRLRDKFGDWDEFEIITVRGLGYKAVWRD